MQAGAAQRGEQTWLFMAFRMRKRKARGHILKRGVLARPARTMDALPAMCLIRELTHAHGMPRSTD